MNVTLIISTKWYSSIRVSLRGSSYTFSFSAHQIFINLEYN